MKILSLAARAAVALGLALAVTGCANVRGPAPAALSFYAGPLDAGTSTKASKRGEACAQNILGAVAWGDASIDAAKKAGGITQVASVEQVPTRVLGYYARFCTVVRGE
ncbi:MAG TPA: TRL-like family protein [Moraxellaceae bacterium]|nr:TRL-like family protein [Moraxellaceae bacterium]